MRLCECSDVGINNKFDWGHENLVNSKFTRSNKEFNWGNYEFIRFGRM